MTYSGIFCTEAEMQFKAGENVDVTGDIEANHNQIAAEVEAYINCLCKHNFSDNYSNLNDDLKKILSEAASNMCAIYLIQYNMAGYTTRIEAENMINMLWARFNQCLELLKDERIIELIKSS